MTHSNTPGALISYKGHTLSVDEGHALLYGLLGGFVATSDEVTRTIAKEPHYTLSAFIITFLLGEAYSRAFADVPLGPDAE